MAIDRSLDRPGIESNNPRGLSESPHGSPSFSSRVSATAPVAWYDFQDANYTSGVADSTDNSNDLNVTGTVASGPAFRNTTTKSADFAPNANNNNYFNDGSDNLGTYVKAATAVSLTFSFRWDDAITTTSPYAKIWGWRNANNTNIISCISQFPGGTSRNLLCVVTGSDDVRREPIIDEVADNEVHIITFRYLNKNLSIYVDGSFVTQTNVNTNELDNTTQVLQLGGPTPGGTSTDYAMDHFHINDYALDASDIVNMHQAYMNEITL